MAAWVLLMLVLGYVGLLFAVAWYGDRRPALAAAPHRRAAVYALSLAVYCTSWTFYGAVGSAVETGWDYLPIYLGPILVFTVFYPVVRRMVRVGRRQHATSIADFLSARYGKSQRLAALVTIIAVVGALPYIALQLKSIAGTYAMMTGGAAQPAADTVLLIALALAGFAILFGTRRPEVAGHNRGMVLAIAFESLVKLVALCAVALLAMGLILAQPGDMLAAASDPARFPRFALGDLSPSFVTLTVLSMAAILCLPRQFHVTVVECEDKADASTARWLFPLYLAITSIVVVPIAIAGSALMPAEVAPDFYVLSLPMRFGGDWLSVVAFIGGFSAATGMVIVAAVALSTMITNDLFAPLVLSRRDLGSGAGALGRLLVSMRRAVIVALLLMAYFFYRGMEGGTTLAGLGTLSFAAAAQFAPALVGGLYWRVGHRTGVLAGLVAGFMLWFYTLMIPAYLPASPLVTEGAFGLGFLKPTALFGLAGLDLLTHGALWSLGANMALYFAGSLAARPRMVDQIQAAAFVRPRYSADAGGSAVLDTPLTVGDLRALIERFVGRGRTAEAMAAMETEFGRPLRDGDRVDAGIAQACERFLARVLGASSARLILTKALSGAHVAIEDVATLLGEASQALEFNRELLAATLENISQAVSVADRDLKLVAWNPQYLRMFDYPPGFVHVGRPVADLLRHNAQKGECGPGAVEEHVNRRIERMRRGDSYTSERERPSGQVLKINGNPMPGGGYVTSFTDITENKRIARALSESERSIRFYMDNIPALISYVDRDYRLRFANRAFCEHFGRPLQDVVGRHVAEVLSAEQYSERAPHMAMALEGEAQRFDIRNEGAADEPEFFEVLYAPQKEPDGGVPGFFVMYQDVTPRRQAERALARVNEELEDRVARRTAELKRVNADLAAATALAQGATASKTRFLAAASHDLLQPLNAARLFASALHEEVGEGELRELVDNIDRSIASADRLLRALLDISKLDAGGLSPSLSAIPLNDLFDELARESAVIAEQKGLRLTVVRSSARVLSDRNLLRSVLQNLLSNAVRYTPSGCVLMGARRRGAEIEIQVLDTGPGIPADKQREIFEEFRRLESNARTERGLGLGLAITERIARLLGHDLSLASEPGKGSVFAVRVPKAKGKGAARPVGLQRRTALQPLAGAQILVIDNEPEILTAMQTLLSRWGCRVQVAGSAEEARDGAPEAPDVVVLDYHLDSGRTGIAAYEALVPYWGARPHALLLTADNSKAVTDEAKAAGMPILAKPVEPARLRALLNQLLKAVAE